MAPTITVVIFAVVGWIIADLWGGIAGAAVGYVLSLFVGLVATKISGGLLPSKVRRNLAEEFSSRYPEVAKNQRPQSISGEETQRFIEIQIERIAKQALMASPGYEITYAGLREAGERTIAQEPDTTLHPMLQQLADYMVKTIPWDDRRGRLPLQ